MNRIPSISDEQLNELYQRIKPVARKSRGDLYYIRDVDPRGVAFTWDPKYTQKAKGLQPLQNIVTYHTYGYYGFFKPSVAEVIAQIPKDCIDQVVAFETKGPEDASDLNQHIQELNDGYHVATTTLYEQRQK